MGLYKRGRNWYIDYRYPRGRNGKRIRELVGPSKEEASIVLSERMKDIRHGRNPELRVIKPVLFKDHAAEVIAKHYSTKRSRGWADLVINVHLVPYFGERHLGEINPKMIADYVAGRLQKGVKAGTVNRERAVLSKILSLGIKWGTIHANAAAEVEKLEEPKGRLRFLTHEEADALITAASRHLRPAIVAALETGGRRSEILGLRWEDVDLGAGLLCFSQTNTKNAKRREIPMTETLSAVLHEQRRLRFSGGDARDYVFTRHGKRLTDIRTAFKRARVGAGLGPDVTFHTLRHTFASWYAMRPGSDLNLLRELLGHQEMKTTMIYAHLSPDYRRSARSLMGRQPGSAIGGHAVDTGEAGPEEVQA